MAQMRSVNVCKASLGLIVARNSDRVIHLLALMGEPVMKVKVAFCAVVKYHLAEVVAKREEMLAQAVRAAMELLALLMVMVLCACVLMAMTDQPAWNQYLSVQALHV